jgi:hypothetical protein
MAEIMKWETTEQGLKIALARRPRLPFLTAGLLSFTTRKV